MNELKIIEHKSQRVLLTSQLAESYGTTSRRISENYTENKSRYIEGKHFYCLDGEQLKEFKREYGNSVVANTVNKLYIWTERGAFLHAKSLNTNKAWEVYDSLVEHYFKVQENKYNLPTTYIEALERLLETEKEKEQYKLENQVLKPKGEYFDCLVERNLLTNFRDTAKEFNMKQKDFINFLIENKFIYRDQKGKVKPYSQYVESGLFELKEFTSKYNNHADVQTLITPKGRETFRLLLNSNHKKIG